MPPPAPEFSRIVSVTRISPKGIEEQVECRPAERAALAKRFDLVDLSSLKAELTLTPESQNVLVTGSIEADLVQRCVVTLEPITSHFDLNVDVLFIPAEENKTGAGSPEPDDMDNEFELFSGGKIDIGEMVAQQFGVNIDPYPRKANAALPATEFGTKIEEIHPFAALAQAVENKKINAKTED